MSDEPIGVSEALAALFESLDKTAQDALQKFGHVVSCKKGCNHCCKLLCTCSFAESVLIAETLLKGDAWEVWLPKLREAALKTDFEGVDDGTYFSKKHSCVFLNDEGACSIYSIRPAACRFHLVVSPPENCDPDHRGTANLIDFRKLEHVV